MSINWTNMTCKIIRENFFSHLLQTWRLMGLPQTPSPPHLYPQALQLKLYQAFIFSVPILFSIILLLLFYLFYLKRRRDSNISSSPATVTRRLNQPTPLVPMPLGEGVKEELKENLPIVIFNEDLSHKDSQCCVCLGDFELSEQLHQIPSCKHLFHIDCIHHWLKANYTCPLCRCYIYSAKKLQSVPHPVLVDIMQPSGADFDHHNPQSSSSERQVVGVVDRGSLNISVDVEESNSGRACLRGDSSSRETTFMSVDAQRDSEFRNSVIIQIEVHPS